MKPEELQLGDIVATTPSGMPIRVVAIHRKKVAYHACTDRFSWVRIGLLQPIPLTFEILEKNGFDVSDKEVMQYHFEEDGEKYHFSLRQMYDKDGTPHGYSFYAFNVLTLLDYVHELQHALRLCGIDKEIEI
jgi:hypothetical protein